MRARNPDSPDNHNRPSRHREIANQNATTQQSMFERFRERLASGSYDAVIGNRLRNTLRGAAAHPGLEPEMGALRLALVRLLNEERDPSRLAASVSRIASVAAQIVRLNGGSAEDVDEIRNIMLRQLDTIEREFAIEAEVLKEHAPHDPHPHPGHDHLHHRPVHPAGSGRKPPRTTG